MSIVSRPGLRIRKIKTSSGRTINHVIEVEDPGEIERLRDHLEPAEYDAAMVLRHLWATGCLNPESRMSALERLGMPRMTIVDEHEDYRLEAHDKLKAALRSMGMLGMAGRYAAEVVIYDRKVKTVADLSLLREALGRLAIHLGERRRAAQGPNRCALKCGSPRVLRLLEAPIPRPDLILGIPGSRQLEDPDRPEKPRGRLQSAGREIFQMSQGTSAGSAEG